MTSARDGIARLFAWLRLALVPLAALDVAARFDELPAGYGGAAVALTAVFALGAVTLFVLRRAGTDRVPRRGLDAGEIAFDALVAFAFLLVFSFDPGQPLRAVLVLPVVEGAIAFGVLGGLATTAACTLLVFVAEVFRNDRFDERIQPESIVVRLVLFLVVSLVVGRLVESLGAEHARAQLRASDAERLRDEVGRRFDALEAANRCARALASSLEPDRAFAAFTRELRGVVPFDRLVVMRFEDAAARVVASAGVGAEEYPVGSLRDTSRATFGHVGEGRTLYRHDLAEGTQPEEHALLALGLRSRVVVPLQAGARTIGLFSLSRRDVDAFTSEELELLGLVGRLIASAVQNMRAFEVERETVEELRRLSTLRADFVSLVSHELRSPMAAVIGAARTLRGRWRELSVEQRDAFLGLITSETGRLAALVRDVLDSSRVESGTLSYTFEEVDLGELVRETVAAADTSDGDVDVVVTVREPLPRVRADAARLRQVLTNLIDNAVKYSPPGGEVQIAAYGTRDGVRVEVTDDGPGIAPEEHAVIFEKFGRATRNGVGKPGTGLGLYIAKSIAEAHGGSLTVRSAPARGSTFTLSLRADGGG